MNKLKMMLFTTALVSLFACTTTSPPKKTLKTRFLKDNISQAELNNTLNYKQYHYRCKNSETGSTSYLATYVYYKNYQGTRKAWLNCQGG